MSLCVHVPAPHRRPFGNARIKEEVARADEKVQQATKELQQQVKQVTKQLGQQQLLTGQYMRMSTEGFANGKNEGLAQGTAMAEEQHKEHERT